MATRTPNSNITYYAAFATQYSLFFDDLEANMEEEGAWLDATLQRYGAREILDASCGTGRQAIPLARRGYRVTGVDPCTAMLDEAKCRTETEHLSIAFRNATFTELPRAVDPDFDAVIALGNGLCHHTRLEDIREALSAMRRCCRRGGLCLVGIKHFDRIRQERPRFHRHAVVERPTGRTTLFEIWNYADPILVCTAYSIRESGRALLARCATTREYMLTVEELQTLAHQAGFGAMSQISHASESVFALHRD